MRIDVVTLFPRTVACVLGESILARALARGCFEVHLHDIRDQSEDKHRTVDDTPYGGGPGMVLRVEPVVRAVEAIPGNTTAHRVLLTPQGRRLDQRHVAELARQQQLILICGHYEGFDERIRLILRPEELSIGDYILTGGELAAMVIIDAMARLLPGVLGDPASAEHESFSEGCLEHPHYTRPISYRGHEVPDVLRSGHHARIAAWRREQALARTREQRPDLLAAPRQGERNDADAGDRTS